jgi:hypothetical protein
MRAVARRLARLEEVLGPRTRHATLKDLILASMGEPLPEGVVWGGPLAEALAALPAADAGLSCAARAGCRSSRPFSTTGLSSGMQASSDRDGVQVPTAAAR